MFHLTKFKSSVWKCYGRNNELVDCSIGDDWCLKIVLTKSPFIFSECDLSKGDITSVSLIWLIRQDHLWIKIKSPQISCEVRFSYLLFHVLCFIYCLSFWLFLMICHLIVSFVVNFYVWMTLCNMSSYICTILLLRIFFL